MNLLISVFTSLLLAYGGAFGAEAILDRLLSSEQVTAEQQLPNAASAEQDRASDYEDDRLAW